MPAFQLAKLKSQINDLGDSFTRPKEFRQGLKDILEKYANWGYRPGLEVTSVSLIPSYHMPPLVLHLIEQEIIKLSQKYPGAAISLADNLWQDEYLEPRLLAVTLLGQCTLSPPEPVINRIREWGMPGEEKRILDALFESGTINIRKKLPEQWLGLIEGWIVDGDASYQALGIRALLSIISDSQFANLPPVFRMLGMVFQRSNADQYPVLEDVFEALAYRSPSETAYFLRQQLTSDSSNDVISHIARRTMSYLPQAGQESIRDVL